MEARKRNENVVVVAPYVMIDLSTESYQRHSLIIFLCRALCLLLRVACTESMYDAIVIRRVGNHRLDWSSLVCEMMRAQLIAILSMYAAFAHVMPYQTNNRCSISLYGRRLGESGMARREFLEQLLRATLDKITHGGIEHEYSQVS